MLDPYLFVTGLFQVALIMLVLFGLWQLIAGKRPSIGALLFGAVIVATLVAGWMNPELLSWWDPNYVAQ